MSDELIGEGFAREFVNRIQNLRKSIGLDITDRIAVNFNTEDELEKHLMNFVDYIKNEVLADTVSIDGGSESYKEEFSIGEYKCKITIQKVI